MVNYLPVAGTFSVSPSIGYELNTVFLLSAPGWYDFDDDSTPLRYQFGYNIGGDEVLLNIKNQSNFYYSKFPASTEPIVVFVKVFDDDESFAY